MVFKLVRTDTTEPCKIQLPVGKHLIGRGKLLDCEDKRVSRNHGELEVIADKVVIKALHQNPCFIVKKGVLETQILKQNCESDISNGDKFGLLPDSYWYELLHCADIDNEEDHIVDSTRPVKQDNNSDSHSTDTEVINSGNDDGNNSQVLHLNLNESVQNDEPGSPSLIGAANEQVTQDYTTAQSPVRGPIEQNAKSPEDTQTDEQDIGLRTDKELDSRTDGEQEDSAEPNTPSKRCHSPEDSSDTVKKIKTEPVIKQDPDAVQAGPSSNQADTNSDDGKDQKAPQPAAPNPVLRERCMYGANCYRRNPQHKAQFSHPCDADWGTGAQAVCPYGAACRKSDPRHWRDHEHPPGVAQPHAHAQGPPPDNAGKKKRKPKLKKRKSSDDDDDGDDDDASTPGLIVQGKRVRKTVTRPDTWSGSESENEKDPYATDESDEWQPSSDMMTDSQLYTPDM